ncbi:MAG TPA: hypothetical protein VGI39_14720 [Polyangiaceae bacterium]|jgi:hypothetical protein
MNLSVRVSWLALLAAASCVGGCKKDAPAEAAPPAPSAAAASPPTGPSAASVEYAIDPAGKATIDMPAPNERIKAETSAAKGALHVDLHDLAKTRGDVFIDLDTFTTHSFGDAEKDATQTHHSHTWLQIDEMERNSSVRERNRWVHFSIRSIDGLSAGDVSTVPPTRTGGEDVRVVTLVAHGDVEVHSFPAKAPKAAPLEVRFHFAPDAPPEAKPTSIEVVSKEPLTITLADHDVKPRDAQGIVAQKAFAILGTKVADVANVSVNLLAKPAS